MKKDIYDKILKEIPNSKPAKDGVIIDLGNNTLYHLFDMHSSEVINSLPDGASFYLSYCSIDDIHAIFKPHTPSNYLLKLQADAIVDSARLVRVFRKRKNNKSNWSLSKYYTDTISNTWIKNISKGKKIILSKVPCQFAFLNTVNAMCMKTPSGNIIAISEPLRYFLYFMNIFTWGEYFEIAMDDRYAAYIIALRLILGFESFDFDLDPRGELPKEAEDFICEKTECQLAFIYGHEYSHHLLGHLNNSKIKSIDINHLLFQSKLKNQTQYYQYNHKEEYDADWYSIKYIKSNSEYREKIANAAFETLLYFNLIEKITTIFNPNLVNKIKTHPSPISRIKKLRSRLQNNISYDREYLDILLTEQDKFFRFFSEEHLPFHMEQFEIYGSYYLPSYKRKILIDRVDF